MISLYRYHPAVTKALTLMFLSSSNPTKVMDEFVLMYNCDIIFSELNKETIVFRDEESYTMFMLKWA